MSTRQFPWRRLLAIAVVVMIWRLGGLGALISAVILLAVLSG